MEMTVVVTTQEVPSQDTSTTDIAATVIGINASNSWIALNRSSYVTLTEDQPSTAFFAFYFVMRFLFCTFALFGNMLTITAVVRFESLRNNANFLICSLAVADIGCITFPVNLASEMLSNQPIFVPLCLIHRIMGTISTSMNIISILGIAIDRYLFIDFALKYPLWVSSIKMHTVTGIVWGFQVTITAAMYISTHHLAIGDVCRVSDMLPWLVYHIFFFPLRITIGLTVPFYIAIGRITYKQGKAIAPLNQPYNSYEAAMNRQQKKIAKMMGTVLGVYFACLMPQLIGSFIHSSVSIRFWLHYEKIAALFYWLNIWLNPLIYAWKGEDFRVAFHKLLGLKPGNSVHPANQGFNLQ